MLEKVDLSSKAVLLQKLNYRLIFCKVMDVFSDNSTIKAFWAVKSVYIIF